MTDAKLYKIEHVRLVKETRDGHDLANYWHRAEGDGLPKLNLFEADMHALRRAGYQLGRYEDTEHCDIYITIKRNGKYWQIDQLHLPDNSVADFGALVEAAKHDLKRANRAAAADYRYYRSHRF